VMYTLAGIANPETGWGQAAESWAFMEALERIGGPTWFRLGDRDLATNVERTRQLKLGQSLSQVTSELCRRLGVHHPVIPMSDDAVRTIVHTDEGALEFQEYFVKLQCRPRVHRIEYRASMGARPSAALRGVLSSKALSGIVICPSNPYLSVAPILALDGMREAIVSARNVVAVSPIIGGRAVKGPAAKIMQELGSESSATEAARFYQGLVHTFVIDRVDSALAGDIRALGMDPKVEDTLMRSEEDRVRLARKCLSMLAQR
ncbi:MAG: 2-phospho-L-lactate transferase CofD family protein, partial [Burkholderiales bacterium]